uniref:RRM domain-containing protein n=1 Tax=Anopheles atroparvus TaxID=41427 RepID=A0AAG5DTJ8_ANOAO
MLRRRFSVYGRVIEALLVTDSNTGESRGYGYIYFQSEAQAYRVQQRCNGMLLCGRSIQLYFST